LNGIALLGWNPSMQNVTEETFGDSKHEVMCLDDMIKQFKIGKVSKSGAKFDIEKLNFFNSSHIRMKFSPDNLSEWREMLKE